MSWTKLQFDIGKLLFNFGKFIHQKVKMCINERLMDYIRHVKLKPTCGSHGKQKNSLRAAFLFLIPFFITETF